MRRHPGLFLTVIILVAIAAGFFVYPKWIGAKWLPWRLGLDLIGGSELDYQIDLSKVDPQSQDSVITGLRGVIERRINLFGVSEPRIFTAQTQSQAHLIVDLAGVRNVSDAIKEIGQTPLLDFREVEGSGSTTSFVYTNLTGQYVTSAQLATAPSTGVPEVQVAFNDAGAKIFERITTKIAQLAKTTPDPACVDPQRGNGRPLAIFLDNQLIEIPCVYETISGGRAVITGKFTFDSAKRLVERFNAGALPAPITLANQRTVSPTLGGDSLKKTMLAGLIGTLLVILFMLFYYRLLGLFAAFALVIYIVITLGVFKVIPGFQMSLAGLTGFILTIGMAVDANILIFERIKEEMKRGLPRASALEEGFRRAWPSIRDSNTSTIITAVILYYLTSSFVQGFALTLLIGVLVSLFSAITTTRLFLRVFLKKKPAVKTA